jgi:predicted metal-binding protein
MLKAVPGGPSLVVCSTCRLTAEEREDAAGRRGGALFHDVLADVLQMHSCAGRLSLQTMPCLFACARFCTVQLRAPGKFSYVLGGFTASRQDAASLLDYAVHYLESADGVVPYGLWPEGVKGHFITRSPPEGFVGE